MLSDLIGNEDFAIVKGRAQDRNQWRNRTTENKGQEPAKIQQRTQREKNQKMSII